MVLVFTSIPHDRKMLKHGRAGVPMEVMGLMLGEFIDDYTAAGRRDLVFLWEIGNDLGDKMDGCVMYQYLQNVSWCFQYLD